MVRDTHPMQADGGGSARTDGPQIASRQGGAGESGGGAYPNPHTAKPDTKDGPGAFLGHGGQSEIAYTGGANPNATTKED
jgi:hypothetical protein